MAAIPSDAVVRNGRWWAVVVWGLYLASFLFGLTWIVGLAIAYVKRDQLKGTLWEGHMTYAIRTAWLALGWGVSGVALLIVSLFALIPILAFAGFLIFLMLGFIPIWFFVRSLLGLMKALAEESVARPRAWLF
jgi:uncharacterized membrane protein